MLEYERAEDLLRQGRYAEAIDRFRELLSQDPERAELRGRVAEAYRLAGNTERAFHHFHKASALYARQKDLLGSARMLEAANQVSPNEPDVLYRLAEVLKQLSREKPLKAVLRNLVKAASAPGDRRRLWALDELTQLSPNDAEVQVERAKVLSEVGRVREAVRLWAHLAAPLAAGGVDFAPWLLKAAQHAEDEVEIGVQLARLLLDHERGRDALGLLVPYYERFPDDVPLLETLLDALRAIGAKDKVLPARLELLKARTRVGQRSQALEELRDLLEVAPRDPRVLEVSAHACAAFGLNGEACRLWYELAELYHRHRMGPERDRVVLLVLKTKPNHEGALALGARVLRTAGRVPEAEGLERRLAEVRARPPTDMPTARSRGADSTAPVTPAYAEASEDTELADSDPEDSAEPTVAPFVSPREDPTMVLSDDDVLQIEEDDHLGSISDAFETGTPSAATRAGTRGVHDEVADSHGFPGPRQQPAPIRDPFFDEEAGAVETPEGQEEITFRMDDGMSAELQALRAELDDDEATATDLEAQDLAPAPRPRGHSGPSHRLVSDLLEAMHPKK